LAVAIGRRIIVHSWITVCILGFVSDAKLCPPETVFSHGEFVLGHGSHCSHIQLEGPSYGDKQIAQMTLALPSLRNVQSITLRGTSLGKLGLDMMAKLLARHDCEISTLEVVAPSGEATGVAQGFAKIFTSLPLHSKLRELALRGVHLDAASLALLAALLLEDGRRLESLVLTGCWINSEGVEHLARGLQGNKGLSHLDLSDNAFDDMGVRAIAASLRHNSHLSRLDLNSNRIGHAGIEALSEALEVNVALMELVLEHSTLLHQALSTTSLDEALRKNQALQRADPVSCSLAPARWKSLGLQGLVVTRRVRWQALNGGAACPAKGQEEAVGWNITAMRETGLIHLLSLGIAIAITLVGIALWRLWSRSQSQKQFLPKYL